MRFLQLNALALCKNVKRAIDSASDLPPLTTFPMDDQVSFRYHMGVFAFLNENYSTVGFLPLLLLGPQD